MQGWKKVAGAGCVGAVALGGSVGTASAEVEVHRVNEDLLKSGFPAPGHDPENDDSWFTEDTNSDGTVTLTDEFGAPTGWGTSALKLTTANDVGKARRSRPTTSSTGRSSASTTSATTRTRTARRSSTRSTPPIQLQIDTNGLDTAGGFTTLVYEPYNNPLDNPVLQDQWQLFNATNGNWWSTRAISCNLGLYTLAPGAGGPPFATPNQVALGCPGAVVLQIGVSIGSNSGANVVATDGLRINIQGYDDSSTNFESGPK